MDDHPQDHDTACAGSAPGAPQWVREEGDLMLAQLTADGWALVGFDSPTKARLHKGDFVGFVELDAHGATFRYSAHFRSPKPFLPGRDYPLRDVEALLAPGARDSGRRRAAERSGE